MAWRTGCQLFSSAAIVFQWPFALSGHILVTAVQTQRQSIPKCGLIVVSKSVRNVPKSLEHFCPLLWVRQILRDLMSNIFKYDKIYESELIALLKKEPDWDSFTDAGAIEVFKSALLSSQTYICKSQSEVCGYLRALVDGFGIYVSELYVAPAFRNNGYGKELLKALKQDHPDQAVYVLSDEDRYYEKLGLKHVGSVFQL